MVLATSAPEKELKLLRDALDAEDHLTAVTSAEDADTAKPAPDILQVALTKIDVAADRAVMVGGTVWDGQACAAAGVRFVGCSAVASLALSYALSVRSPYMTIPPTCWPTSTTARSLHCGPDPRELT